jgi:hypothetical protein
MEYEHADDECTSPGVRHADDDGCVRARVQLRAFVTYGCPSTSAHLLVLTIKYINHRLNSLRVRV